MERPQKRRRKNSRFKGLLNWGKFGIIWGSMAIKVTRKDQSEANENIIRRFNRKVLQSGVMPLAKSQLRFSKPISKRERRVKAILREARKGKELAIATAQPAPLTNKDSALGLDCSLSGQAIAVSAASP